MVSKQKQHKGMFAALKYLGVMAICATLAVGGYMGYEAVKDSAPLTTDVSAYAPKTVNSPVARHDSFMADRPIVKASHMAPAHKKAAIVKVSAKKHHGHAKAIKSAKKHHGKGKVVKVKASGKHHKGKKGKKVRV